MKGKDLADYQAREVESLRWKVNDSEICTAPLTAGGLTVLEAFSVLKALYSKADGTPAFLHARLEALRLAWKDRLELLSDPLRTAVPIARLVSVEHARQMAGRVETAVREKRPLAIQTEKHLDQGTNNFSSVDRHGNMVALTLTNGGSFGAQVTVDGLGLTLGHGMSRFDPRLGHPNAPGPGKPVLALGGAGGVKIPNAIFEVLLNYVLRGAPLDQAIAAPRLHCTGMLDVTLEPHSSQAEREYLSQTGFKVQTGPSALVSAVSFDQKTGECRGAIR